MKNLKQMQSLLNKLEDKTDWIIQANLNLILKNNDGKTNTKKVK
jgi:hypothetical protein